MDRQETLRRRGRRRIFAVHIIGKSAHQLRAARPGRIGMLALDLVEQRGGELVLAAVEPVLRRAIEGAAVARDIARSEEHTSELQSLMRHSYAVFCLKTKKFQLTTYIIKMILYYSNKLSNT